MAETNTFARTMHDVGLAVWCGGSLMGAIGLNAAAGEVDDPGQRARVANAGWSRWTPANLAGIGAYLAGSVVLTAGNKGRMAAQRGVGKLGLVKTVLTMVTLAETAYARFLGQKVISAGDVPVEGGASPRPETPEDVAKAQRQLRFLQWAIPFDVAALIAISARMGEQQRPAQVVSGVVRRLLPDAIAA